MKPLLTAAFAFYGLLKRPKASFSRFMDFCYFYYITAFVELQ